jgi:putative ABC transport system ATP-binding protein
MLLEIEDLRFRRGIGAQSFTVEIPHLRIERGEMLAVTGESGSGKSTILELLGLIAEPLPDSSFDLIGADGTRSDIARLWRRWDRRELARLRARSIGFVLQTGGLLPYLSVRDNLLINRRLLGLPLLDPILDDMVERLEIGNLLRKKPGQLSIGQTQRAAIGRALAHAPVLLLADEPTSALDTRLADRVMALLIDLVGQFGVTAVIATHEQARAQALGLRQLKAGAREAADGYGTVFLEDEVKTNSPRWQ